MVTYGAWGSRGSGRLGLINEIQRKVEAWPVPDVVARKLASIAPSSCGPGIIGETGRALRGEGTRTHLVR